MDMQFSTSIEDMNHKLGALFEQFKVGDIILINGPIGVGKTTFVRHFVKVLGSEWVNSPSYNLIQEYSLRNFKVLHIDLYRITDLSDLESIGFWDCLLQKNYIGFIEWPDLIDPAFLPAQRVLNLDINFDAKNPNDRIYNLKQLQI